MVAGQRADEKSLAAIRKDLGLNQPLFMRYVFYLNDIALIPANGDTLLKIRHFEAKISFRKFLKFRPGFKELLVDTTEVNLIRRDSSDNFSFFFKQCEIQIGAKTYVATLCHMSQK
jgi:hypothetical protein